VALMPASAQKGNTPSGHHRKLESLPMLNECKELYNLRPQKFPRSRATYSRGSGSRQENSAVLTSK
jgi:hypothetical protein